LIVIQRQHAGLAITSRYLRGITNTEIIEAVHERPERMIPPAEDDRTNTDHRLVGWGFGVLRGRGRSEEVRPCPER
jgi:hypothetical protein